MDNSSAVRMVFKILIALIIDAITFLLAFSFWALLNLAVFPAAISAILLSLICLNMAILTSSQIRSVFGVAVYASTTVITAVYYLAVMVFTGVTYLFITPRTYLITYLIITLVYVAVLAGLFISGHNYGRDTARRAMEKAMTLDINLLLQTLKRNLTGLTAGNTEDGNTVLAAYLEMEERLAASTPFGRSSKPAVINMETQIASKLNLISTQAAANNGGDKAFYESLVSQLQEAKTMIMDREKLMFV